MSLKNKLIRNAMLVVALVLSFVLFGTYILFGRQVKRLFFDNLKRTAFTAAVYHLERDEISANKFESVERRYNRIHSTSIRFFDHHDQMVFEYDSLDYHIPPKTIERIRQESELLFTLDGRQFAGIFYRDNQGDFVVVASDVDREGAEQLSRLLWLFLSFFFLGLIITFFLSRVLAQQTFNPFAKLIVEVNAISDKNLYERLELPPDSENELHKLIKAFNYFLERLEKEVEGQRSFLKHASHELRTPLTAIIGNLEVTLAKERDIVEYQQQMISIQEDAIHIMEVLQALLTISGLKGERRTIEVEKFRLDELLWDVLERRKLLQKDTDVSLDLDEIAQPEDQLLVEGNRELLAIGIANLIDNAVKFSGNKPVVVRCFVRENEQLCLCIADKGPGIDSVDLAHIFDLFYRGKRTQHMEGTGIGLHLSHIVFQKHGIDVDVQTVMNQGSIFVLTFPSRVA